MPKESPDTWDLFKSVLLPGKDTVRDYATGVWKEACETDWLKTGYRIEGISFILFIFAVMVGSALLLDYQSLVFGSVKVAGLHIMIVAAVFLFLVLSKTVLLAVGAINEGDSVIRVLTRGRGPASWYRFLAGLISLSVSIQVISESGISWGQLVVFSVFIFLVLGSIGFAVSGAISVVVAYTS